MKLAQISSSTIAIVVKMSLPTAELQRNAKRQILLVEQSERSLCGGAVDELYLIDLHK